MTPPAISIFLYCAIKIQWSSSCIDQAAAIIEKLLHAYLDRTFGISDLVLLVFAFNTLVKFTIIYYTIGLTSPSCVNVKLYIKMRCSIYLFLNNVFYTLCFEKYFMVTNDHSCNSLNCWCNRKSNPIKDKSQL